MIRNYFRQMSDVMRLWIVPVVLGFFLIFSGLGIVFVLDMKVLAMILSGFMFLSGLLGMFYIYTNKRQFEGWSFYFALSILDFILGFLLIMIPEIGIKTISIILSLWAFFQGLGKIIYSLDFQKLGVQNWDSDLVIGIVFAAYGAASIFLLSLSPVFVLMTTALIFSFSGLFQIFASLKRQEEYMDEKNRELAQTKSLL